jgi:hypothetical protein
LASEFGFIDIPFPQSGRCYEENVAQVLNADADGGQLFLFAVWPEIHP